VGHVINVGPDEEPVTIGELAETIAGLLDFKLAPVYMPDRPQEVKHATCSADKARMLIGYRTGTTLEAGLREMIGWIRTRGVKPFRYHLELEIVNDKTPKTWTNKLF
jgi:UDP-glucose 4-epimerase